MENTKPTVIILNGSGRSSNALSDIIAKAYRPLTAKDETEAVELIRSEGAVLVVLETVDYGTAGGRFLEMMERDKAPEGVPVIAVTNTLILEQYALKAGVFECISRPFREEHVLDVIERAIKVGGSDEEHSKLKHFNEEFADNIPGGMAVMELDGENVKMLYCSKGLADMFKCGNYDRFIAQCADDPYKNVQPDGKDVCRELLHTVIATGEPAKRIIRCMDEQGGTVWTLTRVNPVKQEDGRICIYAFVTDITQEKEYELELRSSAWIDPLTGMYNRTAFFANSKRIIKTHPETAYSVLRMNIGSFKLINDLMGREAGDRLLITVASVIKNSTPISGLYARFIADTFALLVPTAELDAHKLLKDIESRVKEAHVINHQVQFYIGIYDIAKDDDTSFENICDRAQIACRSISGSYRRHIVHYTESMRKAMVEEQEIRDDAQRALEAGEFCIYYQPIYGINAKRFVSAEALVRWNHPKKGLISPGKFIPVFEKNGFIAILDLYVMEQVCKYQQKRRENGLEPFPISVNISRKSLYNPDLFDIISTLAEKYNISPEYFRIEITESAYNDNPSQLLETVYKLRDKCFPVLMDDFGSGYSSLNTLKDIPIDLLKLDMKFMQGFEKNERVGTIVTSVARMSRWLNVPMLAEGVETKEQYMFLKSIGCTYIQGFYFAKPCNEEEFTRLIEAHDGSKDDYALNVQDMNVYEISNVMSSNVLESELIGLIFGALGIYEMNGDQLDIIRVSDSYMELMGCTADDLRGNNVNIWSKLHPEDVEVSRAACQKAVDTGRSVRATVRRYLPDGSIKCLEGIHKRLGGTEKCPIICIAFNDVTDMQ